jgi:hypothetical protein
MSMDQNGLATNFGVEFKVETSQVLPLIRMKRDTTTACNSFMQEVSLLNIDAARLRFTL